MKDATSQDHGHPTPQCVHLVDMKDATPQYQGHLTTVHLVNMKDVTSQENGHQTPQGVHLVDMKDANPIRSRTPNPTRCPSSLNQRYNTTRSRSPNPTGCPSSLYQINQPHKVDIHLISKIYHPNKIMYTQPHKVSIK
jgi:hypothetical protein